MPSQNDGTASPAIENTRIDVVDPGVLEDAPRACRAAARCRTARIVAMIATCSESSRRIADLVERPAGRSTSRRRNRPAAMPPNQFEELHRRSAGRARAARAPARSRRCGTLPPPSPSSIVATMSPGMSRSMKNTSTATPSSVGIIRRMRLSDVAQHHPEAPDAGSGGGRTAPVARAVAHARILTSRLLALIQPDVRQVLADVVARRDVPALQLLVVDDDAVPPDGRERCRPARARASRTRAGSRSASSCRARPTACRRARRACGRSAARS